MANLEHLINLCRLLKGDEVTYATIYVGTLLSTRPVPVPVQSESEKLEAELEPRPTWIHPEPKPWDHTVTETLKHTRE